MLSSSARSLRSSRVNVSSRSLHLSCLRRAEESSSSNPLASLASLDLGSPSSSAEGSRGSRPAPSSRSQGLGAGRGTTSGGIHNLRVQRDPPTQRSASAPKSDFSAPTSEDAPGQFDNALEELDSYGSFDISTPAPSQSRSPAFAGLDTFNNPNGSSYPSRGLRDGASAGFTSGPRGRGRGRGDSRGRGGRGRGAARGRGGSAMNARLQVVDRSAGPHPDLAPSTLPPLTTLYTSDTTNFFANSDDVLFTETPAPIFPPQDPLQAKLSAALEQHLGTNELPVIYQRTPVNFLPESMRGPRPDLIKERMKAYDNMLGETFKDKNADFVEEMGGEEGLRSERDRERLGQYGRWFAEGEGAVMGEDEGAGVIEVTEEGGKKARETAKRLARSGISWNGGVRMQEREEMLKIVEGLMVMPKKKKVVAGAK